MLNDGNVPEIELMNMDFVDLVPFCRLPSAGDDYIVYPFHDKGISLCDTLDRLPIRGPLFLHNACQIYPFQMQNYVQENVER